MLFREHNIGLLADDNPEDFAEATLSLLEDQALREEMGSNARWVAEEQLSWKKLTDQLETFYHKILNQSDLAEPGHATEKVQEKQCYVT